MKSQKLQIALSLILNIENHFGLVYLINWDTSTPSPQCTLHNLVRFNTHLNVCSSYSTHNGTLIQLWILSGW